MEKKEMFEMLAAELLTYLRRQMFVPENILNEIKRFIVLETDIQSFYCFWAGMQFFRLQQNLINSEYGNKMFER